MKLLHYKRETQDTMVIVQEQESRNNQFLSDLQRQIPHPLTCPSLSLYEMYEQSPPQDDKGSVLYYATRCKLLRHKVASKLHPETKMKKSLTLLPRSCHHAHGCWGPVQDLPATSPPSCSELQLSKLLFGARILLALLSHALPAPKAVKPHLFSACNN